MGQSCSCLQHRRKLERRASDEGTLQDTDGDELDILIDGNNSEFDELLGGSGSGGGVRLLRNNAQAAFTKRNSKSMRLEVEDNKSGGGNDIVAEDQEDGDNSHYGGNDARLLGSRSDSSLSQEKKNMEVLRSYQKVTGMVDEGEQDLECIMCLDIFSPDNPKVRTLCSCGMNRTNFHMSCLMEWKNRNAKCPVCREYLFYED
uniref:RING-type E3 ubiquitin transferase n=1 Tax=Globisporangium ultimum (strain ATCC 200006 / CBS 805.95 / DAOM BR144) TaxID=431595 RepID=K3WBN4_GLOUD